MVTVEKLEQILKKRNYSQETISKLTAIKTLLKRGNEQNINDLLDVIEAANLNINQCGMVLAYANAQDARDIIDLLVSKNADVNKCLSVLARCNLKKVKDFIVLLESNSMDIEKCLSVIAYGDLEEVAGIIKYLGEENINIDRCISVLAKGKLRVIQKIVPVLKSVFDIETCISVLTASDTENIADKIDYLSAKKLNFQNCPVVLARGKLDQMKKVVPFLEHYKLDINQCLTILAYGDYDEIVKLVPFLNSILDLNECMSVLAYGKYDNIKDIIDIFNRKKIPIPKSITWILRSECKDVEGILDQLEKHDIDLSIIDTGEFNSKIFRKYKLKGIKDLFIREEKQILSKQDIKFLFRVRGGYNQYYNHVQIDKICTQYSITLEQFINMFCKTNAENSTELKKRLVEGKDIWVGDVYPVSKEDLETYPELIIRVAKYSARKFTYLTNLYHLTKDLEGVALDIIMERCGGLFYNYKGDPKVLVSVLIKYCSKRLYTFFNAPTTYEYYDQKGKKVLQEQDDYEFNGDYDFRDYDIISKLHFSPIEKKVLACMDGLLKRGIDEFEGLILDKLNISIDSYNEVMDSIRNKITKKPPSKQLEKKLGIKKKNAFTNT